MIILHVTDLHFNQRWYDWLSDRAPAHDVLVLSGDLLDLANATPAARQAAWISDWAQGISTPLCVCSGNHDLEWDSALERWRPALWLRELAGPTRWTDGQAGTIDGLRFLSIGCATRPKGGEADVWVVHAPPVGVLTGRRIGGRDGGDPELAARVARFAPQIVCSGHVHDPTHWCARAGGTLYLNPGHTADALAPNHILIDTDQMHARGVIGCRVAETVAGPTGRELASPAAAVPG